MDIRSKPLSLFQGLDTTTMRNFPGRAWLFTAVVAMCAALLVHWLSGIGLSLRAAVAFGVLFLLAELAPVSVPNATYSVSFVIAVAALVAVGPAEAAIAASFGALDLSVRSRPDWLGRMVFNGSQLALATAISGTTYRAIGGPVGSVHGSDFPGIFVPLFVAALTFFVVNTWLVSCMVALVRRVPIRETWHSSYSSVVTSTFAFAVLGVLFAMLYEQMGLGALLFILVPLLVARHALQAAAKMDAAYEATLSSLVSAIEAKDAYTRGHAERVSRLTAMVARELHFPERKVRMLRIAALLHDVGKLVVSTAVLTKPGKLTAEEYEHMKWHPVYGCEIVTEIDFLREADAVHAVRHHHERMDGNGYPDNLYGDEVPLVARIVMVADAFDSMTSTRTYRLAKSIDDALVELRRCAATQFDPLVISALDRAIKRHGWEPTPELYGGEQTPRPQSLVHAGS